MKSTKKEGSKGQGAAENHKKSVYISPKQLTVRWACARSSVDRIAARFGLKRIYLGEGTNGMVRFLLSEVEKYEEFLNRR